MADQNQEALAHVEAAHAELSNSSAAGFPESYVYRTLQKLKAAIAKLKGEDVTPPVEPPPVNSVPSPKERGAVPQEWVGKYEDSWTITGDRSKFPDVSPGGAKRISVEPVA